MIESTAIRVVLADDHAVVRKGIREFLQEDAEIRVVAEASDGEEAIALVIELVAITTFIAQFVLVDEAAVVVVAAYSCKLAIPEPV